MIPKDFLAVEWTDLLDLIRCEREEDDTIEFKRGFKGSADLATLNDARREQAVEAIAREAIAFLNTRGGDVVIGLDEAEGRPVASSIEPVANVNSNAERLARSLAALIEPAQTAVSVRAITNPEDATSGVVLVRVRPSLRAPHRYKRSRECK